jgi:hypothetical protein
MKTLLSGCSISDWCGFGQKVSRRGFPGAEPIGIIGNHDDPRCWYNLTKNACDLTLTNVSYGGYSNEEIIAAARRQLVLENYELVILQITGTGRKWFYRTNNAFDFCLSHGINAQSKEEQKIFQYLRVHFSNDLVEFDRTLSSILLIQQYLKEKNIQLILINGIDFGIMLKNVLKDDSKFWSKYIPEDLWEIKGRAFVDNLMHMAKQLDCSNLVALDRSLLQLQIDRADDNLHPGEQSNKLYAQLVTAKIQQIAQSV